MIPRLLGTRGLRPCPHCGGSKLRGLARHGYRITCYDCGAMVVQPTREQAVEAWNRRPPVPYDVVTLARSYVEAARHRQPVHRDALRLSRFVAALEDVPG